MREALPTACLLLLLAAPLAADPPAVSTDRAGARTLPLPREEGVFHFVVFGDRTGGPESGLQVLAQAVRETNLLAPDLVMTVGDLINGYNAPEAWREQARAYREVMGGLAMPWFPVAGNHDVTWGAGTAPPGHHEASYETWFGPLWYSFAHKDAAFVVLYSDEGNPATNEKGWKTPETNQFSDRQIAWLERALAEAKGRDHVFVFLHHPRWVSAYYGPTNWDAVHALLVAAGNVTAVFAGHLHRERFDGVRDGILYHTLAATGAGLPFDVPGTGWLHHFDVVTVRKGSVHVASIPVGAVADPRDMTPEHLALVDQARAWSPGVGPVPLALDDDLGVLAEVPVVLENPLSVPLDLSASVDARGDAWLVRPDHAHATLAPGERRSLSFRALRLAGEPLETLEVPRLVVTTDVLAASRRVSLPARETLLFQGLGPLPPSLLGPDVEGAVRLGGGTAAVEVAGLDLPDGPFTVEAWLFAEDLRGRRALLAKTETSEYGIFVSDGVPSFHVFLGPAYSAAEAPERRLEVGRWHHVAGVFDGSEVRVHVDGEVVARVPGQGPRRRNAHPFFVGADPDVNGLPTSGVLGAVDEVRVSTVARYGPERFLPERRFEPDEQTVLLLHLDACVGPFVPDASARRQVAIRRGDARIADPPEDPAAAGAQAPGLPPPAGSE
jgi:hypothetical protein